MTVLFSVLVVSQVAKPRPARLHHALGHRAVSKHQALSELGAEL
jgi:hypothetical protein